MAKKITLAKLLETEPSGLALPAWHVAMASTLSHLNGDRWHRKVLGPEREALFQLYHALKASRRARVAAADKLYQKWLEGPEWATIATKGPCTQGKVHLRLGRREAHEDAVQDGLKHYKVYCGRGNVVTTQRYAEGPDRAQPGKKLRMETFRNRIAPEDVTLHHWDVARVDCKNCLKKLALNLGHRPEIKSLSDHRPSERLVGPSEIRQGQGRPPVYRSGRPDSEIRFSYDPTLKGKALYRQFPMPADFPDVADDLVDDDPDYEPKKVRPMPLPEAMSSLPFSTDGRPARNWFHGDDAGYEDWQLRLKVQAAGDTCIGDEDDYEDNEDNEDNHEGDEDGLPWEEYEARQQAEEARLDAEWEALPLEERLVRNMMDVVKLGKALVSEARAATPKDDLDAFEKRLAEAEKRLAKK